MKKIAMVVVLATSCSAWLAPVSAQVPELINYQGRLLQGTNLVNGTVGLSLRLFDAATLGTLLYEDSNAVTVVDGMYSTVLGDQTNSGNFAAALTNEQVWLEVAADGTPLSPRERVVASAYALRAAMAQDAQRLAGVSAAAYATGSPVYAESDPVWVAASNQYFTKTAAEARFSTNGHVHSAADITSGTLADTRLSAAVSLLGPTIEGGEITDGSIALADLGTNGATAGQVIKWNGTQWMPAADNTGGGAGGKTRAGIVPLTVTSAGVSQTVTAVFSPAFTSTPVVSLSLNLPKVPPGEHSFVVLRRTVTNFSAVFSLPIVSNIVWSERITVETNILAYWLTGALVGSRPALAYRIEEGGPVLFVRAGDTVGSTWGAAVTALTTQAYSQGKMSMAIINGNPALAFKSDSVPGFSSGLFYTRATDANGAAWGGWVTVAVSSVGSLVDVSMATVNARPAIAYRQSTNLYYVRASDANGTAWGAPIRVTNTTSQGGASPAKLSLAVVSGNPAIGFMAHDERLKYIRASNADGSLWASNAVNVDISTTSSGGHPVLAVINGAPAIVYTRSHVDGARYIRANDSLGAGWGTSTNFTTALNVQGIALAVINGNPAVSFHNNDGNVYYMRALDSNGAAWPDLTTVYEYGWGSLVWHPTVLFNLAGAPGVASMNPGDEPAGGVYFFNQQLSGSIGWIAVEP